MQDNTPSTRWTSLTESRPAFIDNGEGANGERYASEREISRRDHPKSAIILLFLVECAALVLEKMGSEVHPRGGGRGQGWFLARCVVSTLPTWYPPGVYKQQSVYTIDRDANKNTLCSPVIRTAVVSRYRRIHVRTYSIFSTRYILGSFLSESFFPNFSTFFSRNFSIFHIFLFFFQILEC